MTEMTITDTNKTNENSKLIFRQLPEGDMCFERELSAQLSGEYITASEYGRCLSASICSRNDVCYVHRFVSPKLLIIDEAEYLEGKTETQGKLHSLLCQRIADGKTTVIISTGTAENISGVFGDDLVNYLST